MIASVKWRTRLVLAVVPVALVFGTCTSARRAAQTPRTHPPLPPGVATPPPASTSTPAPAPARPAEPLPGVTTTPMPEATVAPPAPLAPRWAPGAPFLLRIGLASDLSQVKLPCCDGEVWTEAGGETFRAGASFVVEPDARIARPGVFRVQIAALKDELQARDLAARMATSTGAVADSVFDAATDLYRVRVGRFADRASAEALRQRLSLLGVDASWVVSEGGGIGDAGFQVSQGDRTRRAEGRWLAVEGGPGGVRFDGRRYRGRLLLYLNDRGTVNVINELAIEEYLRGVVPRELGPKVFDRIEALKAQAVAARTYALRTLGEFADEGYDLCATPRCQVYGGMEDEDPLSDRAVAETAGQVLVAGDELVDALYSSTCGGHTEDVEWIFPLKRASYLRGVPCVEGGATRWPLGPTVDATRSLVSLLVTAAAGEGGLANGPRAWRARLDWSVRTRRAQRAPPTEPVLLTEQVAELSRVFELEDEVDLFVSAEDLRYFFPDRPAGWTDRDLGRVALFVKLGLLAVPTERPLRDGEARELLMRAAIYLGAIEEIPGSFRELRDGELRVATKDGDVARRVDAHTALYRPPAMQAQALELYPGDKIKLYVGRGDRPALAVLQETDPQGASADRTSSRGSWSRRPSRAELSAAVRLRYPGFELEDLDILERGRFGRVSKIRLRSATQPPIEVQGLAVRWTLNLPDTWFSMTRLNDRSGDGKATSWLFQGRGWGHGVGMCQVGAFGMATRGRSFDEILRHYYTGTRLAALDDLALHAPHTLPAGALAPWRRPPVASPAATVEPPPLRPATR